MVDKNNNGIDDRLEGFGRALGRDTLNLGESLSRLFQAKTQPQAGTGLGSRIFGAAPAGPLDELLNGGRRVMNVAALAAQGPKPPVVPASDMLDRAIGSAIGSDLANRARGVFGASQAEDTPLTFEDYLARAESMLGGAGSVNYDPQRETLRGNAADSDARLAAMYRELQDSVAADGADLSAAYDNAIQNSNNSTTAAQAQIQAAADAARSQQAETLGNLGISDVQGNIIENGQDLSTQMASQVADSALRGQASGELLANNQASAADLSSSIGTAAGFEGAQRRADNQASLMNLLAQIDMEEQQQNAALQNSRQSEALSLASALSGFDTEAQSRQDALQRSAMEAANALQIAQLENQPQASGAQSIAEIIQQLVDNGYIDWESADPNQRAGYLNAFAKYQ